VVWNPLKEPIDWVDFAGQSTPGMATVVGASAPRRWEEVESMGWSGSWLKYKGQGLAHFSVQVRLYTVDDWEGWFRFKPTIDRMPLGKYQRPVDITHPLLGLLGITSCVIEDVTQAEPIDDTGIWQIEIKCIEYRSPRLALAAAKGSKATPDDPEDAIIDELRAQNESYAQELER
jgi:hypothetical protein